jgi:hypothetical protein
MRKLGHKPRRYKKGSDKMYIKKFIVYSPESEGFTSGRNNGHYTEYAEFRYDAGRFCVRYSSSGDGDIFPFPEWEELSPEEFFESYEAAVVDEYVDSLKAADKKEE